MLWISTRLKSLQSRVHPDDRQRFVDTMDAVLKQDSGEWDIEYRADLRGNGNYNGGKPAEYLKPPYSMIILISMFPEC